MKEIFKNEIMDMFEIQDKNLGFNYPKRRTYWKKYQQALLELEALKQTVKDELYKEVINKTGEAEELTRLKEENKKLRAKVRELKGTIK